MKDIFTYIFMLLKLQASVVTELYETCTLQFTRNAHGKILQCCSHIENNKKKKHKQTKKHKWIIGWRHLENCWFNRKLELPTARFKRLPPSFERTRLPLVQFNRIFFCFCAAGFELAAFARAIISFSPNLLGPHADLPGLDAVSLSQRSLQFSYAQHILLSATEELL